MTVAKSPTEGQIARSAPCDCGSGLRADRCCALDLTTPARAMPAESLARAKAALLSGDVVSAEAQLTSALEDAPLDPQGLALLADLRRAQGRDGAAEVLLRRAVAADPNHLAATQSLALALFNKGALDEAEVHARNAVRLAPADPLSHNLMGMVMTEAQRPHVGEHHYRQVLALIGRRDPIVLANLAWNLKNQGRIAEARGLYEESVALAPEVFQTWLGWARMEETDRSFARAGELLDAAERLSPSHPSVTLTRAVLQGRTGEIEDAVATLERLDRESPGGLGPVEWSEKGRLLDKLGRHGEAFAAFAEGKRALRELTGQSYRADEARLQAARLQAFFVRSRLDILPRAGQRADVAQPIFVVGFPRSGTTMVEQTLSAHPRIAAGDELPTINELTVLIPRMLNSPLAYPEALADLWLGDQAEGLDNLRDYYLQRARQLGATPKGAAWFTDKMPLNETHLGLISLIFPKAPIIHVVRHPLDVVLSVFANHLTHGFNCAFDLATIAEHYALIADLTDHYAAELPVKRLVVRYEDVIDDQAASVRQMLGFIGAPFDRRCLDFHENRRYARTASYAQVTEKLYDRSRYRYRAYLDQLAPVIPALAPTIRRLGYTIEAG